MMGMLRRVAPLLFYPVAWMFLAATFPPWTAKRYRGAFWWTMSSLVGAIAFVVLMSTLPRNFSGDAESAGRVLRPLAAYLGGMLVTMGLIKVTRARLTQNDIDNREYDTRHGGVLEWLRRWL